MRAIRVGEAVVERVLARQERDDARPRNVTAKIDHEVAEIVFFLRPDRAVGQEDERACAGEAPDRVIRIDPGVHAGRGFELGARRPQFRGDHRLPRAQVVEKGLHRGG
jgi:hypothetical protein